MNAELRRRAYLDAMQVTCWLPRSLLPFAAPSRPELLALDQALAEPDTAAAATDVPVASIAVAVDVSERPVPGEPPRPQPERVARPQPVAAPPVAEVAEAVARETPKAPPPRFALQLLRAGSCLLLVELPTGEPFQSRDPGYVLLKDILRAGGLPDRPQQVGDGEPIRWPLLHRGSLDQGAEAARDYVQGVLMAELEQMGCDCLWLVGGAALRFAGEVEDDACWRELDIDGIGRALALPGLEALMEEPASKAELWRMLKRSMPRWVMGS
ncbi:energy transducer TonB [Stutzerimonas kirkiae]|uniref:energy transducer TonB n=1 Tax=Stutzerimonas kirkiae TaxID=2211392 RepID=UPI00103848A0|nr:energy transducer TonB [Stutzerimonas kirkiae]TBV06626.1 energy transducer TonB [Stutzerimonas kirkiae]